MSVPKPGCGARLRHPCRPWSTRCRRWRPARSPAPGRRPWRSRPRPPAPRRWSGVPLRVPWRSKVEPRAAVVAGRSDGMNVALAQNHVLLAVHLDLESVLGVEQDGVADLDRPHVRANGDRLGPGEAPADLRGGRDEDARPGAALAVRGGNLH